MPAHRSTHDPPARKRLPPPSIACPLQQIPSFLCMSVPHALCLRIPAYAEICRNKQLFISTDSCIFYSCINLRISTDFYGSLRISTDSYGFLLKTVYFSLVHLCEFRFVDRPMNEPTQRLWVCSEALGNSACPNMSKCMNGLWANTIGPWPHKCKAHESTHKWGATPKPLMTTKLHTQP